MLVNAKEVFQKAMRNKYAVPQFNINNLEWAKAILETSQEMKSPVLLGVSEGAIKYMGGYNVIVGLVKGLIKDLKITIPVILHLDHGESFESAKKAMEAGFTSVMFDGSTLPIEENAKITKKVVDLAKKYNVSVEAEAGSMGNTEDGEVQESSTATLKECMILKEQGIDLLAASLGSIHGNYSGKVNLRFDKMDLFSRKTGLPLVLHGGSGIPDEDIRKAIQFGKAKINVNTEFQVAFQEGVREYIMGNHDLKGTGYDPRKLLAIGVENIKKVTRRKIILFDSDNKA